MIAYMRSKIKFITTKKSHPVSSMTVTTVSSALFKSKLEWNIIKQASNRPVARGGGAASSPPRAPPHQRFEPLHQSTAFKLLEVLLISN